LNIAMPTQAGELLAIGADGLRTRAATWPLVDILSAADAGGGGLLVHCCTKTGRAPSEATLATRAAFESADPRPRCLETHRFALGDAAAVKEWVKAINCAVLGNESTGRRLLCILNPLAGSGRANYLFDKLARPILEAANAQLDVKVTTAPGEAVHIARDLVLDAVDGIVICGGDGSVHEVVEGLVSRPDAQKACSSLSLTHLPGGSGNAIAQNIAAECNEVCDAGSLAFIAVKGWSRPVDAALTWDSNGKLRPSVLSIEWGIISDIDFESESMRCLGGFRFQVQAVKEIIWPKRYPGTIDFLPAEGAPLPDAAEFFSLCAASSAGTARSTYLPSSYIAGESSNAEQLPKGWQRLEQDFSLCIACNATYVDKTTAIAAGASLSDGAFTLVKSEPLPRCSMVSAFIKIDDGEHLNIAGIEAVRIRAMRLVPRSDAPAAIGIDGERISSAGEEGRMIEAVCYPGVFRFSTL